MSYLFKLFVTLAVVGSVDVVLAAQISPNEGVSQPPIVGNACQPLTSGSYGVSLLGANKTVSDIVINACVAMGEDLATLKRGRGGSICAITSGYRSAQHNAQVGGASKSQHIQGNAVDIVLQKGDIVRFGELLHAGLCCKNKCLGGMGYYNGNKYHVDNRQGINAWGPGYSKNGIPQITNAGVRNLLYTHLKNSGAISMQDGSQVEIATGEVVNTITSGSAISPLFSQIATQGQNEDGHWATNPTYMMQPSGSDQIVANTPPSTYSSGIQQQETQRQLPTVPVFNSSRGVYETGKKISHSESDVLGIDGTDFEIPTNLDNETQTTPVSPGKGAFIRCEPFQKKPMDVATVSWSCGTGVQGVKVVGRGFNPRNMPIASQKISPVDTTEYGISCYKNSVKYFSDTCIIEVLPVSEAEESSLSGNGLPRLFGRFCVLGLCFFD